MLSDVFLYLITFIKLSFIIMIYVVHHMFVLVRIAHPCQFMRYSSKANTYVCLILLCHSCSSNILTWWQLTESF